jgi:hypothetical protein
MVGDPEKRCMEGSVKSSSECGEDNAVRVNGLKARSSMVFRFTAYLADPPGETNFYLDNDVPIRTVVSY